MIVKIGDVFNFRFKTVDTKPGIDPYWCFDGQLVAELENDGDIILFDTYYSYDRKAWTIEELKSKGELKFRFNTNDVTVVDKHKLNYYDDSDWFDFSYQKHCYKRYVLKNEAIKSKSKMTQVVMDIMKNERSKIDNSIYQLQKYHLMLDKIENGDLDVYI